MNPLLLDIPDTFESERLTIRVPRAGDGVEESAAVTESLAALRPWMPWAKTAPSVEEAEARCRRVWADFVARADIGLELFLKGTPTLVGGSGLHRMDWDAPKFEIGYWVRTRFAGQGYVTEAVRAITDFAFTGLSANRVEIRMDDLNEKSWRVAERAGFQLEGVLRNEERNVAGELRDTRIYAKLR
jgi:RimJ/RimL family protein N-acetyltransferase